MFHTGDNTDWKNKAKTQEYKKSINYCSLVLFKTLFFLLFFKVRDDNKRQHPCLVDFSKLPETEKNYNLQMSTETLK